MTEQTVLHKQLELEADMLTPISIYHALEGKQKFYLNLLQNTKRVVVTLLLLLHLLQH